MTYSATHQTAIPRKPTTPKALAKPDAIRTKRLISAIALLTPLVLLVDGYHPLADDGAIYVAGVQYLVHPGLYRHDAVFVALQLHYSIFAHVLAALVSSAHIPLPALLLICQIASIFLFLLGAAKAAEKIFADRSSQWGALLAAACCFTLPVAGTSLFIMDPYVTARSFSTPLSLFALAATLDGSWGKAALWLALAAVLHPFMAGFAAIFLVMLALAERGMWRSLALFAGLGFIFCAILFLATRHVALDLPSSRAALSRSYFFLSSWQWYEYAGLVFPLLLLLFATWRTRGKGHAGTLPAAALILGSCACLSSLCFVHRSGSLLLARLQPLRAFHIIYLVGVLLVGGFVGKLVGRLPRRRLWIAAGMCLPVVLAMFAGQRLTYPASNRVEWPGLTPCNQWQQAFLWIRSNTPRNAVFALDADYIESPGEDAQGFRATAERSALADWYKDGGVASMFPGAQAQWWREVQATENLNQATDAQRVARLVPLGATWIVLPARTSTGLSCPFVNAAVRVCRL